MALAGVHRARHVAEDQFSPRSIALGHPLDHLAQLVGEATRPADATVERENPAEVIGAHRLREAEFPSE